MKANESMTPKELMRAAGEVRGNAHAPYSGFSVGAAVVDEKGCVHVGCNVENAAFPEGACAETNAIGAMVSAGGKRIAAIAVIGGSNGIDACTPCGGCRQRILEFADANTKILLIGDNGAIDSYTPEQLLPLSFRSF